MSPRPYALGARAAAVADTRERVVIAARELFSEGGFHRVPIDEVARRADVARATVYHQFGSKLGLLEAVLVDFEHRADLPALANVIQHTPPDQLLRATISDGCRYWSTDPQLARKIIGLGAVDPDASALLAGHDAGRLQLLTTTVRRLADANLLRPGCPTGRALDILWLLTSFDTYDQLTRGRNLTPAEAADILVALASGPLMS
ncbi:MAG TPA: helix-turn-helix domain-containing protein [Pseudonocardiaceae bacterium]|nr:helix-turn-helix domain-containing protein [Pseudonocardiaceae bacterium]